MKFVKADLWFIVFLMFFLVSTMSAVTYLKSDGVFDVKVSYINNVKAPYSVILEFENDIKDVIFYDVEIIYEKENLVVGRDNFECVGFCERKIVLKKIFFDDHKVVVRSEVNGKYYEKELNFNLDKIESNNLLILKPVYILQENVPLAIDGKLLLDIPSKVQLVAQSKVNEDVKTTKMIDCNIECNFSMVLDSAVFGDYTMQVYLPNDVFGKDFVVARNTGIANYNLSKSKNVSVIKVNSTKKNLVARNLFGEEVIVDNENGNVNAKGLGLIKLDNETKNNFVEIESQIISINSMRDIKNISNLTETVIVKRIDGFAKLANSSFNLTSYESEPNPIVFEDEKIYLKNREKYIDLDKNESDLTENWKLIPGIYKKEKVVRYKDGSEIVFENLFAYGLVSINTKKPLYHKDELTDFLIVVLDKYGFLVSDANLTLIVQKPSGKNITLMSENLDIYETTKNGVYSTSLISNELGKYNLYAYVKVDNMLLEVKSFYNVVESFPFDILRDVPATIDPWQGPFRNEFTIKPLQGYYGIYRFVEVFSSDFDVIETDADEVKIQDKLTYLIWKNLSRESKLYYVAQTPLKTPYLYYLGKSKINYGGESFYENRSWLFAIDPAGKTCDFSSPCVCGAGCSPGDGSSTMGPGYETIDSCTDRDKRYEWVDDITVTNLNGSYFGVGDTIEICVDATCDVGYGGDRFSISYKDGSSGWQNSDVIFYTGNTYSGTACVGVQTYCINQTLTNYVGKHHVRGSVVYQQNSAPLVCSQPTYHDHDDVEFDVLDKLNPKFSLWNLDNGTSIGNGLRVIRGKNITAFANWDLYIKDALILHNANGSFYNYTINSPYDGNYTNYTFETFNLSNFPNLGIINVSSITAWEKYFNLSNITSPDKYFEIFASLKVNHSILNPYIIYNGSQTNFSCQITDEYLNLPYSGVNVSFYHNVTGYLGYSITNSTGWANISFIENVVGDYVIECNFSDQISDYYLASSNNFANQNLFVKENGTDISPPLINSVSANPDVFSIGGKTTIKANVTDDKLLTGVFVNITFPNSTSYKYPMVHSSSDWYEYNFSLTTQDGVYNYFIEAYDNSSNEAWSSDKSFSVAGIRTYIGIMSTKDVYKIGENINLTAYIKTSSINNSQFYGAGESGSIVYTFDSSWEGWTEGGTRSEWERGVNSNGFVNQCDNSNCLGTDLNGDYRSNSNQWAQSPEIDFTGVTNLKVTFWRMLEIEDDLGSETAYFEGYDGSSWNIYYQNPYINSNPFTLSAGTATYNLPELEDVSNARIRFRLYSDGSSNYEGWGVDTVNLSFTPAPDKVLQWHYFNDSFGLDNNKTTAIKISMNITNYSSVGSDLAGTDSPDLEIQIYNGTDYSTSYFCNLDSSKLFPYDCEFVIKNNFEYLDAWKNDINRKIRVRAINLDKDDFINWTSVKREFVTPSLIENHGIAKVTSILLEQFKNSTGGIVQTMYNQSIELNASETKSLDIYWSFSVPGGFKLGNYTAYVALTDSFGNVLQNEDDLSYINDSYEFEVKSLIFENYFPSGGEILNENFDVNLTLDTSFIGQGGWCGYSLNGALNVSMFESLVNFYEDSLLNISDGNYNLIFYCNDSSNFMINTGQISFNVLQSPRISFVSPTDANDSFVPRPWIYVNTSINDSSFNSSWIEFSGTNYSMSCNGVSGINYNCFINISNLLNGNYVYRACANDSLNNVNCTDNRVININATLPEINVISPINETIFNYDETVNLNISTLIEANATWYQIDLNGTNYFLNKDSILNWSSTISNLSGGYHTVTFFANDSIGNIVNASAYFYIIYDKQIKLIKDIVPIEDNSYKITLNLTNYGKWNDYILYDFIDENFTYYNLSLINNGSSLVSGPIYFGNLLTWNLSLNTFSSQLITYYVNGSNIYDLENNFVSGVD